jgi:hypothetical protein
MDLFDTLKFAKILVRTTFLGTLSLTVPLLLALDVIATVLEDVLPS